MLNNFDYRGSHEAPSYDENAPLYDLTLNGIYPEDVYSSKAIRYYGTGFPIADRSAFKIINRSRNKPNDKIEIYRAVPKDTRINKINAGDWVTIVKEYAVTHGQSVLKGEYKILSKIVRAKELYTDGNSWLEWGVII